MPISTKACLQAYLQHARDAVVWKLDGLSEYDVRRPLVPSGTNLLGIVKHLVGVEAGYLGDVFARPFPEAMPWAGREDEPNVDMWATVDETREHIVTLYRRVCDHADRTIDALDLDARGQVSSWPEDRREVTLHQVLVHMIAETHRHAGHADLVRELIDGSAGLAAQHTNMPSEGEDWWSAHRLRVEQSARAVREY